MIRSLFIRIESHLFFLFTLLIFSNSPMEALQLPPINNSAAERTPVAFKGRFRPFEAYARLWLHEFYGEEYLKPVHRGAFHLKNSSASDLLFYFHLLGHTPWDDAPLFSVEHKNLRKILAQDPTQTHFSYLQLDSAIYRERESNLQFLTPLILYYFAKQYNSTESRIKRDVQELSDLSKGLWVMRQGDQILVKHAPESGLWAFLTPNLTISTEANHVLESAEREYRSLAEESLRLLSLLREYKQFETVDSEAVMLSLIHDLSQQGVSPQEISHILELRYPLHERLNQVSSSFKALPSKRGKGEWLPLKAIQEMVYTPQTGQLVMPENFTLYADEDFAAIRHSYLRLEKILTSLLKEDPAFDSEGLMQQARGVALELSNRLYAAYATLEGKQYLAGNHKAIFYPSYSQLNAEVVYYKYPFIASTLTAYGVAILAFLLLFKWETLLLRIIAWGALSIAFFLHTFSLILRSYILQRPPVSNMLETAIYVPWTACLFGFLLYFLLRNRLLTIASATIAFILLLISQLAGLNNGLENVQAVLDSQYWLLIHVLMVVGSYGAFALAGILGHIYLGMFAYRQRETPHMELLAKSLLQAMYIGVVLLIPGTILGGVWAAESWGRFWDWDPKESWAFISICIYLIWIHAYTFNYIHRLGLAIGSVVGLVAISFTWYGVNYILGTGLHSYGFGFGGEVYYYLYLAFEILFILFVKLRIRAISSHFN
jgi:ABC-type transport system involved in cytochrome c biogenesis permease subunit